MVNKVCKNDELMNDLLAVARTMCENAPLTI